MRETAARICRDYLNGVWKHVTAQNIVVKRIRSVTILFLTNDTCCDPIVETNRTIRTTVE